MIRFTRVQNDKDGSIWTVPDAVINDHRRPGFGKWVHARKFIIDATVKQSIYHLKMVS